MINIIFHCPFVLNYSATSASGIRPIKMLEAFQDLGFNVDVLQQCIIEDSNEPYWELYYQWTTERDLRNPKHTEKLKLIRKKMGLE